VTDWASAGRSGAKKPARGGANTEERQRSRQCRRSIGRLGGRGRGRRRHASPARIVTTTSLGGSLRPSTKGGQKRSGRRAGQRKTIRTFWWQGGGGRVATREKGRLDAARYEPRGHAGGRWGYEAEVLDLGRRHPNLGGRWAPRGRKRRTTRSVRQRLRRLRTWSRFHLPHFSAQTAGPNSRHNGPSGTPMLLARTESRGTRRSEH